MALAIEASHAALWTLTGNSVIGVFQTLLAGKTEHLVPGSLGAVARAPRYVAGPCAQGYAEATEVAPAEKRSELTIPMVVTNDHQRRVNNITTGRGLDAGPRAEHGWANPPTRTAGHFRRRDLPDVRQRVAGSSRADGPLAKKTGAVTRVVLDDGSGVVQGIDVGAGGRAAAR